ncbi:cytochrome P450 6B2-like [Epargyreus clarus]|uniref:cytochrome P450 6B2-like n=1 Tax=Epargyreus clarus TaxID=520877 RepID=UPI003C2FE4EC
MIALTIALVALGVLYYYGTKNFDYWKKRGVKYEEPIPVFGSIARIIFSKISVTSFLVEIYNKYPTEKVVGFFKRTEPQLVIRDPDIAKQILSTDFHYFYNRGLTHERTGIEPLFRNIFFADGDVWRLLRQRLTPAFTSGKLRAMFPLIVERAEKLQARVLKEADAGSVLDARDLMACYTTDFIGACAFGLDSDSLSDENSAFRKLGSKIFKTGLIKHIKMLLKEAFPPFFNHFSFTAEIEKEMLSLIVSIMQQRNYEPSIRNDFIDMMLECRKQGKMIVESLEKINANGTPEIVELELDDILIVAQVFIFFAAGFETSSSSTSFTLHQLAYNPEVQRKVQEEIDRVLAKRDNKLSYEAIKEMNYLHWTFNEGMRLFPSVGFLIRESTRPYTFKDLDFSIDKGVAVMIPTQALHKDPQYFENPDEFQPERFNPEMFHQNTVYFPFGAGPRACVGERLGRMQSIAGLAAVLSVCSVEPAPTTQRHLELDPHAKVIQSVKGGIPLLFRKR